MSNLVGYYGIVITFQTKHIYESYRFIFIAFFGMFLIFEKWQIVKQVRFNHSECYHILNYRIRNKI
jgi:hypothetical protein